MTHLSLAVLGSLRATLNGEPVPGLTSTRLQALLVYLAVEADRAHSRRELAEMIWPNRPEGEALSALRYALSNLRTAIRDREVTPPFLLITRTTLQFNTTSDYELDIEAFQALLDEAETAPPEEPAPAELKAAAELYRGGFLEGFFLPDATPFDEWLMLKRELFTRRMSSALQRLATIHERRGEYKEAQIWVRRRLQMEPWQESAHRQLMRVLALSGQRAEALAQYEACRQQLREELSVEPERATQALHAAIREGRLKAHLGRMGKPMTASRRIPPAPSDAPFVAREDELTRLNRLLEGALASQGQAVFITGEAGSGKTALWQTFARRAMEAHTNLIVAAGQSSAQAGVGDPYLSFREILQTLTGDVEPQRAGGAITPEHARRLWDIFPDAARTLVTRGPDLLDRFVPAATLLSRAQAFAPPGLSWLTRLEALVKASPDHSEPAGEQQAALFEQVTQVLIQLAHRHPMIVVLDDLQWADRGSLSLLFHLGRRLAGSRILLIGVYRPGDVALGRDGERHPLASIVNELQRDFGDICIDLERAAGRAFVEAYLDAEPNRLDDTFRKALTKHTGGNPLFTIEMVDALQARGDLVQDASDRWVEGAGLNWELLPARIEAVIAERVHRLSPQAQEILSAASVEGETFTTEVLAEMLGIDETEVFRRLSEPLSERHRLVHSRRLERLSSDGRRLSHYQFRHFLFQKYLYHQLDQAERAYLHRRAGAALETLYGGTPDLLATYAPHLAHHFQEGGMVEKAIHYRQRAGERAVRLSANEEAIHHFTQGLELVETLPGSAERDAQEFQLLLALAAPLQAARGYGAPETGRAFDRALALCQRLGEMPRIRPVLWLLGSFYTVRAEHEKALELHQYSLQLAEESGHSLWVALAHWVLGSTLMYMGEFRRAAASLDRMVELYDPDLHHSLTHQLGQDPGVDSLTYSAWTLWFLGYPDRALERSQRAVALADELGHPLTQAFALGVNGILHQMCRSQQALGRTVDRLSPLLKEEGLPFFGSSLSYLQGLLRTREGDEWIGLRKMEQALTAWQKMGNEIHRPHLMAWLAEAYGRAGELEQGLTLIGEALAVAEAHDERYFEAEIHRIRGELLLRTGDEAGAEASFQRAIEVAQGQEAKSWDLRATMSLSRLWRDQGRREEAHGILSEVYDWFSEGFDTPDLRAARQLLEELSRD